MPIVIVVIAALCALTALVVVALGVTVSRASTYDAEDARLATLARVHSPSGKSFFHDDDSVLELAAILEEDPAAGP